MKRTLALLVAFALLGLVAPVASAAPFDILSGTSILNLGVDIGLFIDDDDDPNTPDVYAPLVFAEGQGDRPQGSLPAGDGTRNPGFSNGLSAQVDGTLYADPSGFELTGGSSATLLDSGEWQVGAYLGDDINGDPIYDPAPISSQIGIYIDLLAAGIDARLVGRLSNLSIDLQSSGPLVLGPSGSWTDPAATLTLIGATLDAEASGPTAVLLGLSTVRTVLANTAQVIELSGTYDAGLLTIPIDTAVYVGLEDALGVPFFLRISVLGEINAVLVPEPSTIAMFGMGLVGVGLAVIRRRQK